MDNGQLEQDLNLHDLAGVGNGYVDIFTTGGALVRRFATQGTLNSPWGLTLLRGNPAHLYFTAGPNDENDGEFGYLQF